MFKSIINPLLEQRDKDYPERSFWIDMYTRVLNGEIYEHLNTPFHVEFNQCNDYIPIHKRIPSVIYGLPEIIVNDSISMLFSESHFPQVDCNDEVLRETLQDIIKESRLNKTMIEAARIGSVGSVAILMQVLRNRMFFKALSTQYLTPEFDREAPDTLVRVVEKYKVRGYSLRDVGYSIEAAELNSWHWFQRDWDAISENVYLPWLCSDEEAIPVLDESRSTRHELGFVPIVWIKNLPGGNGIDGRCTFKSVIDIAIEIDYQLSMAGRALKYSADPRLVIINPADPGQVIEGSGNALIVPKDGDAKMLEINGKAADAVIQYVRALREMGLEVVRGNRVNVDKISAAQSGRAMEMMNQSLVWLADELRISYGECGLLDLLKMIVRASKKIKLQVNGAAIPAMNEKEAITLRWPDWYPSTADDKQKDASTVVALTANKLISRETGIKILSKDYDIEEVQKEIGQINDDVINEAVMQSASQSINNNRVETQRRTSDDR